MILKKFMKNVLNEMYCTNEGQLGSLKVYDCSLEGKVCQDGACVSSSSGEVTYPAIGRYFHPADTNKDWKISMGEYASYKSLIGVENCNQDHLYCQTAGEIWAFGFDNRYVSLDPYTFFPSGSLNYLAARWMNEANKNIASREDYVYAGESFPICATDTGQLVRCK